MRILHITDGIPPKTLGGTGRIVTELALAQVASGHEVGILSASNTSTNVQGVTTLTIPERSDRWAHWRCVFSRTREKEVLDAVDTFSPDVVHAHTISRQCGYRWMPMMNRRKIRLVLTCHDVSHVAYGKVTGKETSMLWQEISRYRWTWNPFRHALIRRFLLSADKIITVSDALRYYLEQRGLKNMETIHNGIDTSFWRPTCSAAEAREKLNVPKETFLFLIAGRLGHDKGSLLVASALPPSAGLLVAGDGFGPLFETIKNRTHFFLRQSPEEMKLLYTASDAVLVPSRCLDCFPTVCLEAMAMERPVLATSWGGARESVEDGKMGWIIDPMDETAWRERMKWCIEHAADCIMAGKAGRMRTEQEFTVKKMAEQVDRVYSSI